MVLARKRWSELNDLDDFFAFLFGYYTQTIDISQLLEFFFLRFIALFPRSSLTRPAHLTRKLVPVIR